MAEQTNGHSSGTKQGPDGTDLKPVRYPEEIAGAAQRRNSYPYRFPYDRRQLSGKFDVKENARRLLRYFYFERRLGQAIGAWALAIPDFEVKVESGRHLYWHMDAARQFRERLHEQEMTFSAVDEFRDAEIDKLIDEMLSAADTAELLVGLHQVLGKELANAYRHHIDNTDPVTDAPTIRMMKQILLDYEPMLEWAEQAIEAYIVGGADEPRLAGWRWHLQRLLASIGGITGGGKRTDEPSPLRIATKPFERNVVPMRDSRFEPFTHTGDYEQADPAPRFAHNSYGSIRLHFMRAQRDEVDAIEAFGTFLWDIRFMDFLAEHYLARITWDESRHTEIGHKSLLASGYDPFELKNRLTSSTCRGPMEPAYAMAEINLFGEVGVLKTINGFIDDTKTHKDALLHHIADFIRADERTHVRKGQHILKVMTRLGSQELEQRTRELFTECLVSLGAAPFGGDLLSREDLIRLVGE
jgi:hypothetical protein